VRFTVLRGALGWRRDDPQVVALQGCHDWRLAVAGERPTRRARAMTPTRRGLTRAASGSQARRVSWRYAPNGAPSGRAAQEQACGAFGWRRAALRSLPLEPAHSKRLAAPRGLSSGRALANSPHAPHRWAGTRQSASGGSSAWRATSAGSDRAGAGI
jgi:hypothetical protein